MSLKQNRRSFLGAPVKTASHRARHTPVEVSPLSDEETNDVRPQKVAKAKKLIGLAAYPSDKVVKSLADQIARFF
jgi:hypothetical protein